MKKKILPILIVFSVLLIDTSQAQVSVNVNLNVGPRPVWGLPGNHIGDYYYFPEIDMYYSIPRSRFVYLERGRWVYISDLPRAYRHYDLHRGYKVIINDPDPFSHHHLYRDRYAGHYMAYRPPVVIVDKRRGHDRWDRRDRDDDRRDKDRRRW